MRELLEPNSRPSDHVPIFTMLGQGARGAVTMTLPGGGFALLIFSSLMRALDYGQVYLKDQRLTIRTCSASEILDAIPGLKRASTSHFTLDRCPRCGIATVAELASLNTADSLIRWWAIARSLQRARLDLYLQYAMATGARGDLERAREIALEIVGHVTPDAPGPHMFLGQIAIQTKDAVLLREAQEYLRFLKFDNWDRELTRQAGTRTGSAESATEAESTATAGVLGAQGLGSHDELTHDHGTARTLEDGSLSDRTTHTAPMGVMVRPHEQQGKMPSTSVEFSVGDLVEGAFRVKDTRHGGMGVVYIVELEEANVADSRNRDFWGSFKGAPAADVAGRSMQRRWFALKMLRSRSLANIVEIQRLEREGLVWCTLLPHPNVVRAFTTERISGQMPFVLLEFVQGGSLRDRIVQGLDTPAALRIALHVCRGMHFLKTSADIVHRDIKPANILMTVDGVPKITDFGLVQVLGLSGSSSKTGESDGVRDVPLIDDHYIAGSIPYMSPEQFQGRRADTRSDIYSFGVVLYEMLAGRRPFDGSDFETYRQCHVEDSPPALSEVANASADISDTVLKCLAKRPEDRFQNFGELGAHLAAVCRGAGIDSAIPETLSDDELQGTMTGADWQGRGRALFMIGEALTQRDHRDEAHAYLESAIGALVRARDLDGGRASDPAMGRALHLLGRFGEAAQFFRERLRQHATEPDSYVALARSLTSAGQIEEGLAVLRDAVVRFPSDRSVPIEMALLSARHGSVADANAAARLVSIPADRSIAPPATPQPWWRRLWGKVPLIRPPQPRLRPGLPGWNEGDSNGDMRIWRDEIGDMLTLVETSELFSEQELVDETQRQRTARHTAESRSAGLIEVDTVTTSNGPGWSFIYKRLERPAYIFTGMLFLKDKDSWQIWTVVAGERGIRAGARESTIKAELLNEAKLPVGDERAWARDPYQPTYKGVDFAVLRCLSDDEQYDQRFPDHPLTKVRRILATLPTTVTRQV